MFANPKLQRLSFSVLGFCKGHASPDIEESRENGTERAMAGEFVPEHAEARLKGRHCFPFLMKYFLNTVANITGHGATGKNCLDCLACAEEEQGVGILVEEGTCAAVLAAGPTKGILVEEGVLEDAPVGDSPNSAGTSSSLSKRCFNVLLRLMPPHLW